MDNREIEKEIIEEKRSISHLRAFLIFLLIAVIAGFITFYYGETKHEGRLHTDTDVLEVRLENIENSIPLHEKRIAKLEEEIAPLLAKPPTAAPAATSPSQTDLSDRVAALEKAINAPRAATHASQNSEQVYEAITLLSAFYRFSNKVMAGKPFANELSSFEDKYGADGDKSLNDILTPLTPYTESGIPTISSLLSTFDDAVAAMKNRDNVLPENASLWDKLVYNIRHMISIRRVDKSQTGTSPDAIIGRAEDDLSGDEIEAAVAEIKSLPEAQQSSFTAWLEDARIASLAPSYMDQIEELVMKKAFDASSSPKPGSKTDQKTDQ